MWPVEPVELNRLSRQNNVLIPLFQSVPPKEYIFGRNMLVSAERTYFCRNIDISAEMKLFLHFCRYSFLQNKLSLPNMQKIIWPKYSAETLFGRTLELSIKFPYPMMSCFVHLTFIIPTIDRRCLGGIGRCRSWGFIE